MSGPSGLQTLATPERIGIAALGIVAAWLLLANLGNQFLWQEVAVILIAVFGVVLVSEFISATVRQRIT